MKSLKFYCETCEMQFINVYLPFILCLKLLLTLSGITIDVSPGFHINEPVINFSALIMVLIIVKHP